MSPARQKPAGKEVCWTGNTSLETDRGVLLTPWEGDSREGREERGLKGGVALRMKPQLRAWDPVAQATSGPPHRCLVK